MACESCGALEGEVTAAVGSLITVTCKACGEDRQIHVSPGPRLEDFEAFSPPNVGDTFKL